MAIGATILEEYVYDGRRMLNRSYRNYRIPTFGEMPVPFAPQGPSGKGSGPKSSFTFSLNANS